MVRLSSERSPKAIPRVSIGLPVFNGEKFIDQSILSVLSQSFRDFEFIISDNGSEDRTEEICRFYAAKDLRIRYIRQEQNRGAAWNHNFVFQCSLGEYFKWQCHDDLCEPTLIEKCVAVLDREPSIVLCYSQFARVDENNELVTGDKEAWATIGSSSVSGLAKPQQRFRALIHRRDACEEIYGLMRSCAVQQTQLVGPYTQSDDNFLAEMALRGGFYEIAEPLFRYRLHAKNSTKTHRSRLDRMVWFDPNAGRRWSIPFLRQFREYLILIGRAPVSRFVRLQCYLYTVGWAWRFRGWLREDLHEAVFLRIVVRFLKKHAAWTRGTWRALKRVLEARRAVS